MNKSRKTAEYDVWVPWFPNDPEPWSPDDEIYRTRKEARRYMAEQLMSVARVKRARLIIDLESKG